MLAVVACLVFCSYFDRRPLAADEGASVSSLAALALPFSLFRWGRFSFTHVIVFVGGVIAFLLLFVIDSGVPAMDSSPSRSAPSASCSSGSGDEELPVSDSESGAFSDFLMFFFLVL